MSVHPTDSRPLRFFKAFSGTLRRELSTNTQNRRPAAAVTAFLALLDQANSVAVFDGVSAEWTESAATGDPQNEVLRLCWDEEGRSCAAYFTEEGIAAGKWVGQSYFCPDNEGDEVQISLYAHAPLAPRDADSAPAVHGSALDGEFEFPVTVCSPDVDGKNGSRAHNARVALAAYSAAAEGDGQNAASELLTALMHECDRLGDDFIGALGKAVRDFDEQTGANAEPIPDHLELALTEGKKLLDLCFEKGLKTADEANAIADHFEHTWMIGTLVRESPIYPKLRFRARNLVALNRESCDVKEHERDKHFPGDEG